jgi:hypothetical protein
VRRAKDLSQEGDYIPAPEVGMCFKFIVEQHCGDVMVSQSVIVSRKIESLKRYFFIEV